MNNKKAIIIGGPIPQQIDPVLSLMPTGHGKLAASIADEFADKGFAVERLGNFAGSDPLSFRELQYLVNYLEGNVVIFMAHLPNVLVDTSSWRFQLFSGDGYLAKLRLAQGETANLKLKPAPKLVSQIKKLYPEMLLVPFKLAEPGMSRVEIVKWMLDLHAGLAVYSYLGRKGEHFIIDALGNEVVVTRSELPKRLVATVTSILSAVRRRSIRKDLTVPEVPCLDKLVGFSRKMQPAFAQAVIRNVSSGRWPGNFSFRCTHGFLSSRSQDGFSITRRNVDKTGLTLKDFAWVSLDLHGDKLAFAGQKDVKPSIDAPVHRVIYSELPWVQSIVHGHLQASGNLVFNKELDYWPCGAENGGFEIVNQAPKQKEELWVANIPGHGFIALIGDKDPSRALKKLSQLEFRAG